MADIDITRISPGLYMVSANTKRGRQWLSNTVSFESWQGNPADGITVDGTLYARSIAEGAKQRGFAVEVDGRRY